MKKIKKTAFAVGTSLIAGLGSTIVSADNNSFGMSELSSGYMNMAEADADAEQKRVPKRRKTVLVVKENAATKNKQRI